MDKKLRYNHLPSVNNFGTPCTYNILFLYDFLGAEILLLESCWMRGKEEKTSKCVKSVKEYEDTMSEKYLYLRIKFA